MKSLKEEFEDFRRERDKTRATPVPVQERFEPGQTVWHKPSRRSGIFRGLHNEWLWLETCDGVMNSVPAVEYTAADPNAKPLPQTCPFCGGGSDAQSYEWDMFLIRCSASPPCLMGPRKPTPEEAVAAWNSIQVKKTTMDDLAKAHGLPTLEEIAAPFVVPADDAPLTKEWLRKVGLDDGLKNSVGEELRVLKRVNGVEVILDEAGCSIWTENIKTIGDARQLCRLLGVPLKE